MAQASMSVSCSSWLYKPQAWWKGNELAEINWESTKAVAIRANNIYINLKGRNIYGIVDQADSLSTTCGHGRTCVSTIFIAAGHGVNEGFETNRIIRQGDVAPTMAVLGGVKKPRECEGAPIYQILTEEY